MDTSAGRTHGRVTGSEEMNPTTMPQGGYVPRGGFMRGRGGGKMRDIREVECYTCHKKGHFSRNCPQHTWNQQPRRNNWNAQSSQEREAIVDDRSVIDEEPTIRAGNARKTSQQSADAWLRGVANEEEEVQDLVMRDLLGREDFQSA